MNYQAPDCIVCTHYNVNEIGQTCKAFPQGIKEEILFGLKHTEVIDGQVDEYVFKKIDEEETSKTTN